MEVERRALRGGPWLLPLVLIQIWAAHAVVFFAHEYAHAVVAWLLGWKENPLDLNYAKPSITVVLIQLGIDQKVNDARIFAAGKGLDAALIAAAGMVIGNGLVTFPLSRAAYFIAKAKGRPGWAMFAFWVTAASVGNFLDYVPIRTFGVHGDMATLARGLSWSPWPVLVLLGIPTLIATISFCGRVVPATVDYLFPHARIARYGVAFLSVFGVFGFYGAVGLLEGGPTALVLSQVCVFFIMPVALISEVLLLRRGHDGTLAVADVD